MRNIAIIPARSGSKGLKDKNIKELNEIPLIAYTIKAAIESEIFEEVYVSTDSEQYAEIAMNYGASAVPLREAELSSDKSSSGEMIMDIIKNKKVGYDNFVLLQPTSPFRNAIHIKEAYSIFEEKKANAVVSLCKSEKSPNIINTINDNGTIDNFLKVNSATYARQNEENYIPNGAIFIVNVDYYIKYNDFYKENCYPYVMNKITSVDIDDKLDFMFCEMLIERGEV